MAHSEEWPMPFVFNEKNCHLRAGRKPPTIPDTTQFSRLTRTLFGVGCRTPEEAYRWGTYNEASASASHVTLS